MREDVAPRLGELIRIRRDLHKHSELGEEHRTAALVAGNLAERGLDVHAGVAGTGMLPDKGGSNRAIGLA